MSSDELAISNVRDTNYRQLGFFGKLPRRAFPRRASEGCRHGYWELLLVVGEYLISRVLQEIYLI